MTLYSRLAAYYPCDDTHGRSLSEDVVGTNNGTAGVVSSAVGKVRQGMFFLSSGSQFRSVPNDSALQGLLGICCWVKFSTLAADQSIISKGSDATDANTSIKLWYDHSDTDLAFSVGDSVTSTTVRTDGLTLAVDTWYHIRCFNDGNRMGIAVNGTLYGSGTARTPLTETGLLYLGRDFGGNYFDGVLDEVALFSSAPTVADGAALYNGGSGASLPLLDSLPGPSGRAGFGTRWTPPSFAESEDAISYIAHGKLPVQRFDGSLASAGVEAPGEAVKIESSGSGPLVGRRYAYLRNLDAKGRVSSMSPLSEVHETFGSASGAITGATNAAPIVVTSSGHGLESGDTVKITGQLGNTAANGTWKVTVLSSSTFELDGSVGNGDWQSSTPPSLKVTTSRQGSAGTNQAQTLSYSNTPTTGSFVLSFEGESTTSLAYNASAATIQAALEAVTTIGAGNVLCTGGDLPTAVVVTFRNNLGAQDNPLLESTYTGATSSIVVTETRKGTSGSNEVQDVDLIMLPTGGTFTLTYDGQTTGAIAYNASASTVQTALEALSNLSSGDVSCTGGDLPGNVVSVEFTGSLAETDVELMTADGSSLTGTAISVSVTTTTEGGVTLESDTYDSWGFEEAASDFTGSKASHVLESTSTSISSSPSGKSGRFLPGSSGKYIRLESSSLASFPAPSGDWSISFWHKWGDVYADYEVVASDGWSFSTVYTVSPARYYKRFSVGATDAEWYTTAIPNGSTWSMVTLTHEGATKQIKLYLDADSAPGDQTKTHVATMASTATLFRLMYDHNTGNGLDQLTVFDEVLTQSQVSELYNSGSGKYYPFSGTSGTNEDQQISITGSPSAGAFTLTYDGQTTSSIAYNATASAVDTALEALSNIGSGDVTCTGGPLPGTAIDVEFTGSLATTNVNEMTATPSTSPSMTASTTTGGVAATMFDLANAAYDSVSGTVTHGVCGCWTADGKGFFDIGIRSAKFFLASTPYDPSTFNSGTVVSNDNLITGSLAVAYDACLSSDGSYVYVLFNNIANSSDDYANAIVQFEHNYDSSAGTCTYLQTTGNEKTQFFTGTPYGLCIADSDTKLYVADTLSDVVRQYSMTANDLTTAAETSNFFSVSSQTTAPRGIEINSDGTEIYVSDGSTVYQYDLSTGYDASTGSYATISLDVSTETTVGYTLTVRPNGAKLYVHDATALKLYQYSFSSGGTDEVQDLSASGSPQTGTFTLTYSGQTTSAIAYNASAATVQTALEALSNLEVGDVVCTGGSLPDTAVVMTFGGSLADTDVAQITVDYKGLLANVTTTTVGSKPVNELVTLTTDVPPGQGTFTLTYGGQTTGTIQWNADDSSIKSKLEALSTIGSGNVVVSGGPINSTAVRVEFTGSLSLQDASAMTASSSMTQTSPVLLVAITTAGVAGVNEIQVVSGEDMTGGTFTISYGSDVTSAISFDATAEDIKQALETLSDIGNGNVLVTGGPLTTEQFQVEFIGTVGNTNMSTLIVDATALLSGGWAAGASTLTYTDVEVPSDLSVVRRQILRTKPGAPNLLYVDVDEEDVVSNTFSSTKTDDELLAADAVVLLDANGVDTNLSRHGVPPDWKRVVASYKNRLFYGVDYVERPVVTIDGDTATGIATDWPNVFDDRTVYEDSGQALAEVNANNQTAALSESTAADQTAEKATIRKVQPDSQRLYHSWVNAVQSFPESVHPGQTFAVSRDEADGQMSAAFSFDGRFFVAFEHSLYQYEFRDDPASAPNGDGQMQKSSPRGVVNNNCVAFSDDYAYLMDRDGCYAFDGNSVAPLSEVIKPIFSGRGKWQINWKHQQWFHCEYFPQERVVRLFVVLDGGPYPRHALCHNVDQQYWWIEEYAYPICSSTRGSVDGKTVVFLGSTGRRVFTLTGDIEGVRTTTSTLRGTATDADNLTIVDSAATFGSELVNAPIRIVDGTGYGQQRIIVAVSGTTLTVDMPWDGLPSTDSVYQIGGVHWVMKTGKLRLVQNNRQEKRRVEVLYEPLDRAQQLDYRLLMDWSETAVEAALSFEGSDTDGVSATAGSDRFTVDLTSRGHAELDFDGIRQEGATGGEKFVTVEASGTTNKERHRLHGIAVSGAE